MAKLHELLAVDGQVKNQADACVKDLLNTFDKKKHHLQKKVVTFRPSEEGKAPVTEEQLDLQTTVKKELRWLSEKLNAAMDVSYQIEIGNTQAKADVILDDGTTLLKDVPCLALLALERRVNELHKIVAAIPTLDPAKGFTPDPAQGDDVFAARPVIAVRTKKVIEPLVLYAATKEHPAQVKEVSIDRPIGEIQTLEWSGMVTVAEKGDMLDRVERLARAVKQARTRANELKADQTAKIGDKLTRYVFVGQ